MGSAARQTWSLTQEAFDGLLGSIGPDRDTAADRYLEIRRNLVRLFEWRGCPSSEEYADEVLIRGNLSKSRTGAGYAVSFDAPASALNAGEYELALKGVLNDRSVQDVGYYYFSVRKQ